MATIIFMNSVLSGNNSCSWNTLFTINPLAHSHFTIIVHEKPRHSGGACAVRDANSLIFHRLTPKTHISFTLICHHNARCRSQMNIPLGSDTCELRAIVQCFRARCQINILIKRETGIKNNAEQINRKTDAAFFFFNLLLRAAYGVLSLGTTGSTPSRHLHTGIC